MADFSKFDTLLSGKIHQRNLREVHAFSDLVQRYSLCQEQKKASQEKVQDLERETQVLREENEALKFALQRSREEVAAGLEAKEHKEKAAALQEELTESHKARADSYQQLISTRDQLEALQEENKKTNELLQDTQNQLQETKNHVEELTKVVDQERASCAEASKELETRIEKEEVLAAKLAQLETENEGLIARWLQTKNAEAEKLNNANAIYEDVVRRASDVQIANESRIADSVAAGSSNQTLPSIGHQSRDITAPKDMAVPKKTHVSFESNKGGIHAIGFDSTGSRILTAGADREVKVWEPNRGGHVSTLRGALQTVTCACFSHDGSQVLAGSSDHAIRIFCMTTGRVKETLTGHTDKVSAVCYSPAEPLKGVSCGNDRCIKVWDLSKGYCVKSIMCHSSCNDLCVTLDGGTICSAHYDRSLRFWNLKTGEAINHLEKLHADQITSICLSPAGNELLTNSRDNTLKVVNNQTFETFRTFSAPDYRVTTVFSRACFSPDARFVCGGSADGSVYIWRVDNGTLERTLKGHQSPVTSCMWSPTGSPLVTGDKNGYVVLWR